MTKCSTTKTDHQANKDFTEVFEGIIHGDSEKAKIKAFLVDQRGFPDNAVDELIKGKRLRLIQEDLLVVPYLASNKRIPAIQHIPVNGDSKIFMKGSKAASLCFFFAGNSPKKADTLMIHEGVFGALAGECLYPDICHVALGSSVFVDKISALKGHKKKILVAQDNDQAGETMLNKIIDILGSEVMGIHWSANAKAKMGMNDILRTGKKFEIDKVFAPAWSIIGDGLLGGFSLINTEFSPIKWAIEGLVAEGVNLLAGKPKCGKSILCMNLAISIATGEKAFGSIDVEQGDVIYLALEDVNRRLKDRMIQMAPDAGKRLDNIRVTTEWNKMGDGGIKKLALALKRRPNTRLVIIDTLKMFRPAENANKNFYNADYEPIARIKREIADKFNVPVLIIHHLRKSDAEDIFDTMSGSTGLTGATDSNIIFEKGPVSANATLHVQGRDIETASYAMQLNFDDMTWGFIGDAKDIKSTDNKQKIYDAIKEADKPLGPKELGDITEIADGYIRKTLPDLMNEGGIKKQGRGKYIYSGDPEEPLNDD